MEDHCDSRLSFLLSFFLDKGGKDTLFTALMYARIVRLLKTAAEIAMIKPLLESIQSFIHTSARRNGPSFAKQNRPQWSIK